MARRSVARRAPARQAARQPALPGFEALMRRATTPADHPVAGVAGVAGPDWEERSYAAGCAFARELAGGLLTALEQWLHGARPAGYTVAGWRTRVLVTRMGDVRVRRRLYHDASGRAHFLLDDHLGWTPRQVATPSLLALLVEWATDVPFADAARRLAAATAGVLSGPTVRRHLHRVATRVQVAEAATHQTWEATGRVPEPAGERVVAPLYVEADGVHVKTQREPAHTGGYELKCASAYEGWERLADPTPGHPRPHYARIAKQVYCHAHPTHSTGATGGSGAIPFWEGASLALHRTYDLSQLSLVVVGGDGATWIDTAADVFPRVVRQRDGFHLARDATRGWGTETGATLYEALRTGDQPTALELLALPSAAAAPVPNALPALPPQRALPPPPTPGTDTTGVAPVRTVTPPGAVATAAAAPAAAAAREAGEARQARRAHWTRRQVARARRALRGQVGTPDAGADWRTQVAIEEVPPGARALGTQEGTNAHLLARRMKHRGMSWTVRGAQAMGKARELVTNGTLAPWCFATSPTAPAGVGTGATPRARRPRVTGMPDAPLPWPQATCPAAHGPPHDAIVAHLQRVLQGTYRLR